MSISTLSLSKIANISSSLMTVLLALNLHSLAARVGGHNNSTDVVPSVVETKATPSDVSSKKPATTTSSPAKTSSDTSIPGWNALPTTSDGGSIGQDASTNDGGDDTPESDPRILSAEQALKDDVATRKRQEDDRIRQRDQQRAVLEQERAEIDKQIQLLTQSASNLSAHEEARRKAAEKEMDRLARVYEQMPPRDAAAVFNVLDMRVMVPIAQRMIPRKISAVMGGMLPDRANILSQYLAGMRKLSPAEVKK